MASDDDDDSQKTEEPSFRRIEDAFKRGQTIYSREVTNFLIFLAIVAIVWHGIPIIGEYTFKNFSFFIKQCDQIEVSEGALLKLFFNISLEFVLMVIFPCLLVILLAILSSFIQNGRFIYSLEPLTPKFSKISPFSGFKRIFSMRSVLELVKGIIKIIIVSIGSYLAIKSSLGKAKIIHDYEVIGILSYIHDMSLAIIVMVGSILFVIAVMDYLYQRFDFYKKLRMSRQELKEEYKETEGSPEIKSKLKRLRAEKAKSRMMAAVPEADVVITNPTHFAVALKYEPGNMVAPILIAKGVDKVALRIREIAVENEVPIVENPPLARELYKLVEIDEEIPLEYYQTVAEIISYVYRIKGKVLN